MRKVCSKCKAEKPFEDFNRCSKVKSGRKSRCRECTEYIPKTKEIANRDATKFRLNNPEKTKANFKKWYEKTKHIKRIKSESTKEKSIIWRNTNRDKINAQRRLRKQNPTAHQILEKKLRDRFYKVVIRMKSGTKHLSCMKLVGCDMEFLKNHIENQFAEGMDWSNHGNGENKWNIDHIKPLYTFNLHDLEEQSLAFHYNNLRPLWFAENIRRSKVDWQLTA